MRAILNYHGCSHEKAKQPALTYLSNQPTLAQGSDLALMFPFCEEKIVNTKDTDTKTLV
jgi:hypothetical protein